jgi:predicted TPR repeat methyltransferase
MLFLWPRLEELLAAEREKTRALAARLETMGRLEVKEQPPMKQVRYW